MNNNSYVQGSAGLSLVVPLPAQGLTGTQIGRLLAGVDELVAAVMGASEDEQMVLGWTANSLNAALNRLRSQGGGVQADVIVAGFDSPDGLVDRAAIRRIGRYSEDRSFRGFTKPVSRVVDQMKESGEIPIDAVSLLKASYGGGVKAEGFSVPTDLAVLR